MAEDTCFPSSNSKPKEEDGHLDHDCPESRGGFYYLTYGTWESSEYMLKHSLNSSCNGSLVLCDSKFP